jgi:hypothetical protein
MQLEPRNRRRLTFARNAWCVIDLVDLLGGEKAADSLLVEKVELLAAPRDDLVPEAPQALHERLTHHAAMTSNVYTHMFFRLKVED